METIWQVEKELQVVKAAGERRAAEDRNCRLERIPLEVGNSLEREVPVARVFFLLLFTCY